MTSMQHRTLVFIQDYIAEHTYSPSFDEIKTHLGLASKSGVHRLVASLIEQGKLWQRKHRARSLEVVIPKAELPDAMKNALLDDLMLSLRSHVMSGVSAVPWPIIESVVQEMRK